MNKNKVKYFKIETFGAVDGPGVRLILFTQGCPLRCKYCHNPESWSFDEEVQTITVDEFINIYNKNKSFYVNGGITVSGGEPTAHLDFLLSLGEQTKKNNIHLTIDTSGYFFNEHNLEKYNQLINFVDLWLVDIKHINHKKYPLVTGSELQHEIKFINYLETNNKPYWVRQVLVPDLTDNPDDLKELGLFLSTLNNMNRFELLPYHDMAKHKYESLNINYALVNTKIPSKEDIAKAMKLIKSGFSN